MKDYKIGIIGLGYVGLPLLCAFSKKFKVVGFDINKERVKELKKGIDRTKEVGSKDLLNKNITYTSNEKELKDVNVYIITVPTPIDKHKNPDLSFLKSASITVGKFLKKNDIVVYESTVYPGLTEEEMVPILEKVSSLKWKKDFFVGYSPERVNPGDKEHTIEKIKKIVAGDTKKTAKILEYLYGSIIEAGVYVAPDIKTAEAAKVIENTQRDINIAFVNELSLIFNKMNIDTKEVLKAASTKWNFLNFQPGLVGGHCIGVDPYYLTFKAKELGYHPELILSGRKINDYMGIYVASQTVKLIIKENKLVNNSKVLIMGFTFKENITDIRNTRVIDIYDELKSYGVNVFIYDPNANAQDAKKEYGIDLINDFEGFSPYDAIIVATAHKIFIEDSLIDKFIKLSTKPPILVDVKGIFSKEKCLSKNIVYWRL